MADEAKAARQLIVEVSNVAWSLTTETNGKRSWPALTEPDAQDVFDRLVRAITRYRKATKLHIQ